MEEENKVPDEWCVKIASTLSDCFSMAEIIRLTNTFGADYGIIIRYQSEPRMSNKQTIATKNLENFAIDQMSVFLDQLVLKRDREAIRRLAEEFQGRFFEGQAPKTLQVRERFADYPEVLTFWQSAQECLAGGHYRESLDNARLTLELLLKKLFNNQSSLENQISPLGKKLADRPKEFRNMLVHHLKIYKTLQNETVKHADGEQYQLTEVRYILETTYNLMDYLEKAIKEK